MADLTQIIISAQDRTQAAFASVTSGLGKLHSGFSSLNAAAGALGAALGVGAISAWASETIKAASALDDLAESTGSTVESLSRLRNGMRISGVGDETFVTLVNKLTVGLSGLDDESTKAAKALANLGITTKDPAKALQQLAVKMNEYADGANKTANLQAILGKGAAQYVGPLKDLAKELDHAATVTEQFAADAEAYEKAAARSKLATEAWGNAILADLLPPMTRFLEMTRSGNTAGLFAWLGLSSGDVADADAALAETTRKIDELQQARAKLAAPTLTNKVNDILFGDIGDIDKQLAVLLARQKALQAVADEITAKIATATAGGKPDAPPPPSDGNTAKVKKAADTWNEFAAATKAAYENALNWEIAGQEVAKQQETIAKAIADGGTAMAVYVDKQLEAVRAYDEQTSAIGRTTEELNAAEMVRQAELRDMRLMAGWGQEAIDIYERWRTAIDRRNAALGDEKAKAEEQRFAREWARTAEQIGDSLTDAFVRAAESGRDFFKSLANDLKRMFSNLVLRPIVQGVMAPIAGGISSALYGGGASAQGLGGGIGNYASAGQSVFGLGDTAASWGGAASGFALSGTGQALGLSTTVFDSAAGASLALTAGGEALAALAAAAPYVAAVVAIGYALYEAFGQQPGGPKAGGYAAAGRITPWNRTDQFTSSGFQPGHFTPDTMDSVLQPVVDSWVQGTAATIKALGGTSAQVGFDLGIDKDPAGDAANRLGIRATVGGRQVYDYWSGDSGLGRDDATLQAAIGTESKRALLAALQASDLPQQIAAVFNTMTADVATSEQIDNVIAFASAMRAAMDAIGGSVLADAQTMWENSQRTSVQNLQAMGDEVIRLAAAMDGSTESMQALATASGQYRNAVVQVLLAIRQVAQQAEAMQGSLVQSIQTDGMDAFAAFNYWITYANQQALQLGTATSPEQVGAISTNVYNAISTAFSTLPAEFRDAYKPALLGFLSEFGSGVNEALTNISGGVVGGTESPFAAVNTALSNAAAVFDKTAPALAGAATKFDVAADKLGAAVDRFAAELPISVNVRLAGSEVNG